MWAEGGGRRAVSVVHCPSTWQQRYVLLDRPPPFEEVRVPAFFSLHKWTFLPTQRERERENSETLILMETSVRSIWTYLTASPCYTTNTNTHERERERESSNSKTLFYKDRS